MARRTYRTFARLFKDSDLQIPIRWYRVPPEWGTLGVPSPINSLDWNAVPWTKTGVGEVYGAPRTFVYGGPPAGGPFAHRCGTDEEFREGQAFDPFGRRTVYAANGLPVCCQPDAPIVIDGGIEIGGSADITVIPPSPVTGGIEIGGSADVVVIQPEGVSGGIEIGGSADVVVEQPTAADGGIEIGGSADVVVIQPGDSTGGIEIGGSADVVVEQPTAADGGIEIGGSADITVEQPGPDTCASYWYTNPATLQTVVMYGTAGGTGWTAGPPQNNNLAVEVPSLAWQLQDFLFGSFTTVGWNGQGSRVFVNGPTEITVSCGLPPP